MKNKLKMILTVGLARSGKSTYVKKYSKDAVVICPDRIRKLVFGHQFHVNAEGFVWAIAKGMAALILEQGKNVLIDATNLNYGTRAQWYRIADEYNAQIDIIWVKTSLKECKKRNERSEEGEKLPQGVIEKMAMIFENPTHDFENPTHDTEHWGKRVNVIEIPKSKIEHDSMNMYRGELADIEKDKVKNEK